ncbi:HAMP domain-containing sensor histidine kinase [Romboutsia lituseburensis]|uniref:HAMP domain-containing sensor histidine kinase n=1 Tax=Romboutsia lituseburensis TaxID=1537 RepID=UPI00215AE0E7|nr:HAMP domain-containing histidine kinase [Romboutsia lituseburensis]MCR8747105.1 HAMP domain-containing histidine kinase [Romboutsia lituseburensis]
MNMKWKLTLRYVLSIAFVAIFVVILNIIALMSLTFYSASQDKNGHDWHNGVGYYTRNFQNYIQIDENDKLIINEEGKKSLDKNNLWVQILDKDSKEVYSYKKPSDVNEKHTPIELINGYKYSHGFGGHSDILAGQKKLKNESYTYLIGFPMRYITKYTFIMENDTLIRYIRKAIYVIIIIDFLIAAVFGYIFSKGLTRPVKKIITGVDDLADGNYDVYYKEKGVYSKVFGKLNSLSDTLKSNEIERVKIEKMREDWIANISHDIKTPLSSIKGYAEVLSEDYDFTSEEISEFANIINSKADYIKELVDDLNLTMKLKNSNSIINKEEVNLNSLVKNSVIDIFNDHRYSDRDIEFIDSEKVIKKNLDKTLIKRVINNLIYNALVHNNEDISISVKVFEDEKAHIIIKDNGKGINEDELKYIFERYYRGTNTGEAHKGSGLGMAIAKEIIVAHGGDIQIRSELSKGTEIEITL